MEYIPSNYLCEGINLPIEMRASSYSVDSLIHFLEREFSNKFRQVTRFADGIMAVFVRDKLMLRNMQTLTVTVTVEWKEDYNEALIRIVASGGREGIFRMDMWGAENAAEKWAQLEIQKSLTYIDSQSRTTHESPSRRPVE